MKLDQYIALNGYCSRRKAKDLIEAGRVQLNGKTATFSSRFREGDKVGVDGQLLIKKEVPPVFIAYHKPKGIICTTENIEGNIISAIKHPERIFPVGRLDKDSEGLILLTNQGPLIDKIANAAMHHEKEYLVTLNLPLRSGFLKAVREGMEISGVRTRPALIWPESGTRRIFRIILTQGMNRQIRRMCNAHGYQVIRLLRVRVMHILLGNLKAGEWRDLTDEELNLLYGAVTGRKP